MILSVGEILIDSFVDKRTHTTLLGGAPFNVAVGVKRSGARIGFYGKVGDDEYGKFIIDESKKYSLDYVNIAVAKGHKTTVAEVSHDRSGERFFKFYRDNTADFQLDINDVNLEEIKPSILHIGTLMLNTKIGRAFASSVIQKAKELGAYISIDANFRDDLFESKNDRNTALKPYLSIADLLKMGLDEILDYTGATTLDSAVRLLDFKGVLFVTDGGNGSHVFTKNQHAFVPTIKVDVVDSTGAGDAYWGTALAGIDKLLSSGQALDIDNIVEIARISNLAGAEAVTHVDAI